MHRSINNYIYRLSLLLTSITIDTYNKEEKDNYYTMTIDHHLTISLQTRAKKNKKTRGRKDIEG